MSEKEALEIARRNGCKAEVMQAIIEGYSPEEALDQYDCLPDIYDLEEAEIDIEQEELLNESYYEESC